LAYDNTNRWTLNKNDRKEKDTHPDYKGAINVDGVDYWLDGWVKDGANGKFISGSLKLKEARQQPAGGSGFDVDLDDSDVPFATLNPALEHRVG
jgi:hypothetical protein